MGTVKQSKLFSMFDKYTGSAKTLVIKAKDMHVKITGEIHKIDNEYCIMQGAGRVVIESQKTGNMLSWKGTYTRYVVKFIAGNATLAEFEIPEKATLSLDEIMAPEEA